VMNWEEPTAQKKNTTKVIISIVKKHLNKEATTPQILQDISKKLNERHLHIHWGDEKPLLEDKLFLKFAVEMAIEGKTDDGQKAFIPSTNAEKLNMLLSAPIRERLMFMKFDEEFLSRRAQKREHAENMHARKLSRLLASIESEDELDAGEVLCKYFRAEGRLNRRKSTTSRH